MDILTKINESKINLSLGKKPCGILCLSYKHTREWGGQPLSGVPDKLDLDCHCIGLPKLDGHSHPVAAVQALTIHYITLGDKRSTRKVMDLRIINVTLCEFTCERDSLSRTASNNIRHSRITESQACQQQFFCFTAGGQGW